MRDLYRIIDYTYFAKEFINSNLRYLVNSRARSTRWR